MRAQDIKAESLANALRTMRLSAGLTQAALAKRTRQLEPPCGRMIPSQISDFERGQKRPSVMNFISIVVACSNDGATLDFSLIQAALEAQIAPRAASKKIVLRAELSALRAQLMAIGDRLRDVEAAIAAIHDEGRSTYTELEEIWKNLT